MKILFISHSFPPTVGGVERQNYDVSIWLGKNAEVTTIANRRGRKFLPLFAPYALLLTLLNFKKYDVILLGSGMLAFIGWFLKFFTTKPVVCIVHGLDITYNAKTVDVFYEEVLMKIYKKLWVNTFLKSIKKFIAVGNETIKAGITAGLDPSKFIFIPNGIEPGRCQTNKFEVLNDLKIDFNKKIVLTSGRIVKRKGVAWFIENVVPKIKSDFIYLIVGKGPDFDNVASAILKNNLADKVRMLGYVNDEVKHALLCKADIFVQPNIKVAGDMEGFGISVIEAASCGLPVVASRLEGLQDAISDGQNGFLIEPENSEAYAEKIDELLHDDNLRKEFGKKAIKFVNETFGWDQIAKKYLEVLRSVIK